MRRALVPTAAAVALPALFSRANVTGESMRPTLEPGDRLLVLRLGRRQLRPGDVVTVRDPRPGAGHRVLVKRVVSLHADGIEVAGDNPASSTDSRSFGRVPRSAVLGRALYRYAPAGRTGRLG